jgi:ElaB/YqjD/DUF883 family membrane-anchored ribosome-binding protein
MVYPGYALNPGDMFQVEPSSVMFATGAPKTRSSTARRVTKEKAAARAEERSQNGGGQTPRQPSQTDLALSSSSREEPTAAELKKQLQDLMQQVDGVLAEDVGAKDKQKFRALRSSVRKAISLWRSANPETISTLDAQFDFLKTQIAERAASASSTPSAPGDLSEP